ncbi:Helix-turn-helix [Acetitomaculum ruminis DSM 5522]|uniref:Helix-turn-helix n=1 Tax=Acetitomaculum ruminis DSM 5522 TaxID=1120918 RepID=A0A1I1A6S4_9FIRM|nr:helix-turn-helix transcriptional regulator [Acetitomaculum ruminis]SFB33675.1 Helix-turn-helix [Acetitomaculum ruminis DSM 5522]
MILADKIIEERKKNGWSQEELAGMLEVSRQAVSKWESAQSTPDLQRVIKMADIFGVSTDYLLKDEMGEKFSLNEEKDAENSKGYRRVSMEEASDYLKFKVESSKQVASAVFMCVISPVLLIFLMGLADSHILNITEKAAVSIGLLVLFGLVSVAVYTFLTIGTKDKKFEYLKKEPFETAYGVDGMVRELQKNTEVRRNTFLVLGVILCILSAVPLVITAIMECPDYIIISMVSLLLLVVGVGVYLMIYSGILGDSYKVLLQEEDFEIGKKGIDKKIEPYKQIYWSVITAVYLIWSFLSGDWGFTWIVFMIGGVLYGSIEVIMKTVIGRK